MTINAHWIKTLRDEIARARVNDLEPLEGGWVHVYRRGYGGQAENVTEEYIASLRQSIARIQAVVAQYHDAHVHRV
jgi:hypothetical protein